MIVDVIEKGHSLVWAASYKKSKCPQGGEASSLWSGKPHLECCVQFQSQLQIGWGWRVEGVDGEGSGSQSLQRAMQGTRANLL